MLDWRKLLGDEGAALYTHTCAHGHTHARTDVNAPLCINSCVHLVTPAMLMQDLIHNPHTHAHAHTDTHKSSEYISVSWPPTQLSRLTFCLVFILSHTHSASTPSVSVFLSLFCPPDRPCRPCCPLSSYGPQTPQCCPLVVVGAH